MTEEVTVGSARLDPSVALGYATQYLAADHAERLERGDKPWAYPAYDAFVGGDPMTISDADLLAPVLLNVRQLSLSAFYWLQLQRPQLHPLLAQIPLDATLEDARDDDLAVLGEMFSVLDGSVRHGVGGTILAKILHRKRPAFIPLYDTRIRSCYGDGDGAPVPRVQNRTWAEFMPLLAAAMREDLRRQPDIWNDIVAKATDVPITRLRALDIVAWRAAGGQPDPEADDVPE